LHKDIEDMIADLLKLADARALVLRISRMAVLAGVALTLALPGRANDADITHAGGNPRGNAVTHWNTIAIDAFKPTQGTNPMGQSRTLAILHAAIHDALNAIDRRFEAYTPGLADAHGASVDAAVAAAAHEVLVAQVPDQAAPSARRLQRRTCFAAPATALSRRRSRSTSLDPAPANTSSRRLSTSPRCPVGVA
jgi:hypothetical protein